MKKYLLAIYLLLAVFCGACAIGDKVDADANLAQNAAAEVNDDLDLLIVPSKDVLEIKEKMFITQTNDILLNAQTYEGKTIKVEGMYFGYFDTYDNRDYNYVQRRSPGCCGNDGTIGFEFVYDGAMPEVDDWIEAIGQIEIFKVGDKDRVRLRLSQLTVKDERGKEFVSN